MAKYKLVSLLTLLFALGCNKSPLGPSSGGGPDGEQKPQGVVGFDVVGPRVFLDPSNPKACIQCHSASGRSPKLENYADFLANIDRVRVRVVDLNNMPQGGISNDSRILVKQWIEQGAQEVSSGPIDPVTTTTTTTLPQPQVVDFNLVNSAVFSQSCTTCHNSSPAGDDPVLETFEDYRNNLEDVVTQVLVKKRMPKGGPALSPEKLALVQAWIDGGAIESANSVTTTTLPPLPPTTSTQPPIVVLPPIITDPLSWNQVKQDVLGPRCIKCHSDTNPKLTSFENKETVIQNFGKIYVAVVTDYMPPRPGNVDEDSPNPRALTVAEKKKISDWMIEGFKD